ncbi:MAG TPA: hypothetical protein PKE29_01550 [Phycisphaerales bacterium]|nr:hypothetical protein [Phycisphaerales bacterium]
MPRGIYRYAFDRRIAFSTVLDTLNLAVIGAESLHGEARVRLDARFVNEPAKRAVVIDTTTAVGKAVNTLFAGFAAREFGDHAFSVHRNPTRNPLHPPHSSQPPTAKKGRP